MENSMDPKPLDPAVLHWWASDPEVRHCATLPNAYRARQLAQQMLGCIGRSYEIDPEELPNDLFTCDRCGSSPIYLIGEAQLHGETQASSITIFQCPSCNLTWAERS